MRRVAVAERVERRAHYGGQDCVAESGGSEGAGLVGRISEALPACVQRVLAPLVELVLKPQTFLVRLDGADGLHDGVDPRLRLELPKLARRNGAFTGVVVRESRVPPDAGVQTL